jgi:transcriptional regulator with GAF, ATPase, and Fis domain
MVDRPRPTLLDDDDDVDAHDGTVRQASPFSVRRVACLQWTDSAGAHSQTIDGRALVGSAPGSDLVVRDPTVSRIHAELEIGAHGLWVRDLGSTNGTFVDGLRVINAHVPGGSRVRLGGAELLAEQEVENTIALWAEDTFHGLVGGSVSMRELFTRLARISPHNESVLIRGETGTGKELVARAIHEASSRADGPFIVVDCAALSESLLEAELFGHARGAFTGAVSARAGALEAAEGGTVFLDEIGELPISMQPKLLRALESKTIRRIGETQHRTIDVRFISATHRDLLTMLNANEFREDLYFRLSVLPVVVPALRERREDIPLLAVHFLRRAGGTGDPLAPNVLRALSDRPWRGNVRELRNFVERMRALGPTEALALSIPESQAGSISTVPRPATGSGLPDSARSERGATSAPPAATDTRSSDLATMDLPAFDAPYKKFREHWVDLGEREYLRRLLRKHEHDVAEAAKTAELNRTYIYRLVRKHDL